MGAYLFFKLSNKKQADEFNKFVSETEEGQRLIKAETPLRVYDNSDIEWVTKLKPNWLSYYKEQMGKGDFKTSGVLSYMVEDAGCSDLMEYFELVTVLFEKAQTKFRMWFASGSCAFNAEATYFSIEQMKRITKNGKRLKHSTSDPEKYQKLLELLK